MKIIAGCGILLSAPLSCGAEVVNFTACLLLNGTLTLTRDQETMIDEYSENLLNSIALTETPVPIRQSRIAFDRLKDILQLFRQIAPLYVQDQPNDSLKAVWDQLEVVEGEMARGLLTASNPEWYQTKNGSPESARLDMTADQKGSSHH